MTGFRSWPVRLAALAAIWGFSFLLIKVADPVFGPLWVALLRIVFGLLALVAVLLVRRTPLPAGARTWGHLAVAAVLFNTIPFTLFALGELHVSSLLAGILNATTPLFALPATIALVPGERLSGSRIAGLLAGTAGVVVVLAPWRSSAPGDLTGAVLCLAAAASYGIGFAYVRRFLSGTGAGPLSLAAGQLLCATITTGLLVAATATPPLGYAADGLVAMVLLGTLGTGLAYVLNHSIVRDAGPTSASTVTYLSPIVATIAGVTLLGDPLGWWQPAGALVILVGAALAQDRVTLPAATPARPGLRREQ